MRFNAEEFLAVGPRAQDFDDMLADCMSMKRVLKVSFDGGVVDLSSSQSIVPLGRQPVDIIGHSVVVRSQYFTPGARLLSPLLMVLEEVLIPHDQIFLMRRHDRSVADFFARNVFYALARPDGVRCAISSATDHVREGNLQTEFLRRYLWVLRHEIPDPTLHQDDLIEKLWINAYLETLSFEDAVFKMGAEEIRTRRRDGPDRPDVKILLTQLMHAREKMVVHFN